MFLFGVFDVDLLGFDGDLIVTYWEFSWCLMVLCGKHGGFTVISGSDLSYQG